jgi:hypothetical protein
MPGNPGESQRNSVAKGSTPSISNRNTLINEIRILGKFSKSSEVLYDRPESFQGRYSSNQASFLRSKYRHKVFSPACVPASSSLLALPPLSWKS